MKPVDINLASSPYRNDLPIWAALGVLSAFALAFTGYNAWAFFTADARRAELEAEIAGHRDRMEKMNAKADELKAALAKVDEETLASQAEFVSSILERRNFSWTQLFNALERVTPWDVKLVSIRPQFETLNRRTGEERVRVQVQGIGRSFESFLGLQESLQDASMFSEITPADYERQADDRTDFNISFTYSSAPPVPREEEGERTASEDGRGASVAEGEVEEGAADVAAEEVAGGGMGVEARPSAQAAGEGGGTSAGAGLPEASPAPGSRRARGGRGTGSSTAGDETAAGGPSGASGAFAVDPGATVETQGGDAAAAAARSARDAAAARSREGGTAASGRGTGSPRTGPTTEVQEIGGKPAFKPRVNPDRPPESGYRGRPPDPEGKK